nr:MAG TPA: hypothetical protein [Caudoviricetes sp.]
MENLSFDEGLKSYKINGDSNRVLRFNPGDINILTRYKEVVTNLEKISDNLPEANINADGTPADNADIVSAQLEAFDNELKKQLNYLFNADVYDILFAGQSPLCRVGKGRLLVEEIIDKIGKLIGKECGQTMDNVNLKVNSYIEPYENRQNRRNKNKKGRR